MAQPTCPNWPNCSQASWDRSHAAAYFHPPQSWSPFNQPQQSFDAPLPMAGAPVGVGCAMPQNTAFAAQQFTQPPKPNCPYGNQCRLLRVPVPRHAEDYNHEALPTCDGRECPIDDVAHMLTHRHPQICPNLLSAGSCMLPDPSHRATYSHPDLMRCPYGSDCKIPKEDWRHFAKYVHAGPSLLSGRSPQPEIVQQQQQKLLQAHLTAQMGGASGPLPSAQVPRVAGVSGPASSSMADGAAPPAAVSVPGGPAVAVATVPHPAPPAVPRMPNMAPLCPGPILCPQLDRTANPSWAAHEAQYTHFCRFGEGCRFLARGDIEHKKHFLHAPAYKALGERTLGRPLSDICPDLANQVPPVSLPQPPVV